MALSRLNVITKLRTYRFTRLSDTSYHSPTLSRSSTTPVMSNYIVTFKDGVSKDEIQKFKDEVTSEGGEIGHTYDGLISGFSAKIQPQTLQAFQQQASISDSVIETIEPDSTVTIQ
ncbi:hypothetical protein EV359DRAFT_79424 [Lentinula novae-zelandiae]|nr:hypothetical protein EV359DRAFT_79424 [Lentinula novae-zelandiae]